jgi:hypothetical protein
MITNILAKRRAPMSVMAAALVAFMAFVPAESEAGGYIGGSIGQSYIELDTGSITVPETFDENDFAFKGFVGYEFDLTSLTLGVEGTYVNFGAPSGDVLGSQIEVDADGFAAFGTAGLDLGPLGIYAKYGMISWDASFSVDGLDVGSDDGTDPAYGVGIKFGLASLEVRGEYEIYDVDSSDDVSMLSVGLVWRF